MTCPVCAWCGDPLFGEVHTLDRQQYHSSCATTYLHTSLNERLQSTGLISIAIALAPIAKNLYEQRHTTRSNRLVFYRLTRPYSVRVAPWNRRPRRKMV
ncbi:MAG TPA: hypothetical protein V6C88_17520 [Chroococcidiopsis sp.]